MRDASIAVLREIGVDTGGSNVQFAINPEDGRMIVIEMNPRVSRSSALASKATGFPIAKVAAKLAVGYTLDEIAQRGHRRRDAGLLRADHRLRGHQGAALRLREVPAGQRPADHADEVGGRGDGDRPHVPGVVPEGAARPRDRRRRPEPAHAATARRSSSSSASPGPERIWYVGDAFENGFTLEEVYRLTRIDPWFLDQIKQIVELEMELDDQKLEDIAKDKLLELKRKGFSDRRLAYLFNSNEKLVQGETPQARHPAGLQARRHLRRGVRHHAPPTCTPPTRRSARRRRPTRRRSWCWAAGRTASGRASSSTTAACTPPSRCARTASRPSWSTATRRRCRPTTTPPTGSTSSRSRSRTCSRSSTSEKPWGVIVQYGGQTPLKLARDLAAAGVPIIGTSADSIDLAEDRERFQKLLDEAQAAPAAQPHRALGRGGAQARRGDRLSGGGAAELRARRPRHGDRALQEPTSSATCARR